MNNIYTLKHSLKPGFEPVLTLIIDTTAKLSVQYFVAGATARDLLLYHVFDRDPGRQTRDIDTAILVSGWDTYSQMRQALIQAGLQETGQAHRLHHVECGLPVDIIPFGDIADKNNQIQWPPEHAITMSVAGFQEVYNAAILIDIGRGVTLKVASLAGLALLKLIAWQERGHQNNKDATDFLTILIEYQSLQQDRLWEDFIPAEALAYDMERQGAFLLGYDLNSILSQPSTDEQTIMQVQSLHQDNLLNSLQRLQSAYSPDRIAILLQDFLQGINLRAL